MANNVGMPRFARASGMDNWTEADTFDVDLLAECLLEDGNMFGGITFDFRCVLSHIRLISSRISVLIDTTLTCMLTNLFPICVVNPRNQPSTLLVSPENSEDGNMPTVGDINQNRTFNSAELSSTLTTQIASSHQMQAVTQLLPTLAAGINQTQLPQIQLGMVNSMQQNPAQGLIFHDHSAGPDVKRPRMEVSTGVPMMHMQLQAGSQAPAIMNIQQLAVAAMQQQGRGRKKSQAQIDRRRERNRILARRTRLRKKFFFESLQKDIMDLQRENIRLKGIVKDELPAEESELILKECDAAEKLPPAVLEACGDGENGLDMQDYNLVHSIQNSQHSFVITDPSLADNPIVFASDDFLQLTGYTREQVLGRNCRFLQGSNTSPDSVKEIRKAVADGEDVSVTLLNYMADGTPFWNRLFIAALRDAQNNIVNFIGVIVTVPGPEGDDGCDQGDIEDDQADDNLGAEESTSDNFQVKDV